MSNSVRIAIIGAGSGVFSPGLVKDLCLSNNLRDSEVCFMDLNQERLDIVHGLAVRRSGRSGYVGFDGREASARVLQPLS